MRKLVQCEHCEGAKQCRSRGGKSCDQCLLAAGRKPKEWATVRCSYCGGRGRVWVEEANTETADSSAEVTEETPNPE